MATLSTTTSSVYSMIGESAQSVASIFSVISASAGIANDYVSSKRRTLNTELLTTEHVHEERFLQSLALESAELQKSILNKIGSDTVMQDKYNSTYAELKAHLASKRNPSSNT